MAASSIVPSPADSNHLALECGVTPQRRPAAGKKSWARRTAPDNSQRWRRGFQHAFLLLNVWIGGQFYLWVRQFELGNAFSDISRPAGVEGWLPIAGMMNLRYWFLTGRVPEVHPAAMFLLATFLAMAVLLRKAFCSWLCPIGTISEWLWRAGIRLFRRNFQLPRWLDIPLRGLKYLLLGFFVWAVTSMSAEGLGSFLHSPYGLIADVKMLNFFRFMSGTALGVVGFLVVASLFVPNIWCRYLCPYGALLGLTSLASPLRVRRNPPACIDCAKCARACPALLPVDQLLSVKSAECTGCMLCVAVCPAQNALEMEWPHAVTGGGRRARMPAWAMAAAVAVLFLGITGFAKATGHWNSAVPQAVYRYLVPRADLAQHPMPDN
ncbi:MAG TPA: 4Fe-4S binding protein [Patescibacteria group bacterium]|nr:4Fe-4S binding protein [Patescibacteria group bacterium]